jgi:hypothetical protein
VLFASFIQRRMAALLLKFCASVRSIWRALRREMGIQFTFA